MRNEEPSQKSGGAWARIVTGVLLTLCLHSTAFAQESTEEPKFSAERPDLASGTATIPPGRYQVEFGYIYANGGGWQQRFPDGALLRFPIDKRSEWRIGIPAYVRTGGNGETLSGLADVSLSVKWRFLDAAPKRPSLAVIVNTNLPTGRADIGSHYFQPSSSLQAAYDLSDKWGLSSYVSYANTRDGAERFDQFGFLAGAGYALSDRMSVFGELYGVSKTGPDSGAANFVDAGVTYLLNPRTQADVSAGMGISGDPKNFIFLNTGISIRW